MKTTASAEHRQAEPDVRPLFGHRFDDMLHIFYISVAALGLGGGVGLAYGWPAGLAVLAFVAIAVYGLLHLLRSAARRSLHTKVPQRRFPRARL